MCRVYTYQGKYKISGVRCIFVTNPSHRRWWHEITSRRWIQHTVVTVSMEQICLHRSVFPALHRNWFSRLHFHRSHKSTSRHSDIIIILWTVDRVYRSVMEYTRLCGQAVSSRLLRRSASYSPLLNTWNQHPTSLLCQWQCTNTRDEYSREFSLTQYISMNVQKHRQFFVVEEVY